MNIFLMPHDLWWSTKVITTVLILGDKSWVVVNLFSSPTCCLFVDRSHQKIIWLPVSDPAMKGLTPLAQVFFSRRVRQTFLFSRSSVMMYHIVSWLMCSTSCNGLLMNMPILNDWLMDVHFLGTQKM